MQGGQGGDQRAILVLQAKMQDEFFEKTGLDDDEFQAAMQFWSETDAEVKGMVMKFHQEMGPSMGM